MDSTAYQTSLILEFSTRLQAKRLLRREWGPMWRLGVWSSEDTAAWIANSKFVNPEVASCLFEIFVKEPVVKVGWMKRVLRFVMGKKKV